MCIRDSFQPVQFQVGVRLCRPIQLIHFVAELADIHFVKGMIEVSDTLNRDIGVDLLKGESGFPLIVSKRPAGPVFDAPVHGVVRLHSYNLDAGLLQYMIGQLDVYKRQA